MACEHKQLGLSTLSLPFCHTQLEVFLIIWSEPIEGILNGDGGSLKGMPQGRPERTAVLRRCLGTRGCLEEGARLFLMPHGEKKL